MSVRRAVVLVGSPRPRGQGASDALARHLGDRMAYQAVSVEYFRAARIRKEAAFHEFLGALAEAEIFVLASPLYVDSLPALVMRALERVAAERSAYSAPNRCAMLAIVNCGFPEARHTEVALDICRIFADQAALTWAGGLGLGGGEAVKGRRLRDLGWAKGVAHALELAADALVARQPVPEAAVRLMAKPLMHPRIYAAFGNLGWYQQAWKHGALRRLWARPFAAAQARPK